MLHRHLQYMVLLQMVLSILSKKFTYQKTNKNGIGNGKVGGKNVE